MFDRGDHESWAPASKRSARVVELEWLEDRIGTYEQLLQGMVLERPTYGVAFALIRERNGWRRITYRGTGIYDYWWETLGARNSSQLAVHSRLLTRRFNLAGTRIRQDVRFFEDLEPFVEALNRLPDDLEWGDGDNPFLDD